MNRKNFIKNGSVAGIAVAAFSACNTSEENKSNVAAASAPDHNFKLNEMTITELQQKMQSGELTSRSVTEMYLKRIDELDKQGPALNSVIELNPDALAIADRMDEERKAGKVRGAMHGIPVLVKDNIDTADKMMTTAGSLALLGHHAKQDAFIISQLREAGAVLLGKTNLSEWANIRSSRSSSGWSSRGGQTKNPYALDRNPAGSSAGSGVAVASSFCAAAIGTETSGSIIAPASFCGVVGIKPTVGLLSRSGIIPISKTQDTAGPMARTVEDAAILLSALTGIDQTDKATLKGNGSAQKNYFEFLKVDGLKGKRIGIEKSFLDGNEGVVALYKQAIDTMRNEGAEIVAIELMKPIYELAEAEFSLLTYEFKDGLNGYLSKANAPVKSLAEVIAFNKQNEEKVMPYFKQDILEICEAKQGLASKEYKAVLKTVLTSKNIIDGIMNDNRLDAISGTSIGLPNITDLITGDYSTGTYFCAPAAMAGYPHITVPMGQVYGLPVGLSFVTRAWEEEGLLSIAYAFEQASQKRAAPQFLPTALLVDG